jgi:hypothetical protein
MITKKEAELYRTIVAYDIPDTKKFVDLNNVNPLHITSYEPDRISTSWKFFVEYWVSVVKNHFYFIGNLA